MSKIDKGDDINYRNISNNDNNVSKELIKEGLTIPIINSIDSLPTLRFIAKYYNLIDEDVGEGDTPSNDASSQQLKVKIRAHIKRLQSTLAVDALIRKATTKGSAVDETATEKGSKDGKGGLVSNQPSEASIKMGKLGSLRRGPDKPSTTGRKRRADADAVDSLNSLLRSPIYSPFDLRSMYRDSVSLDKRGYKREALEILLKVLGADGGDGRVVCRVARIMGELGDEVGKEGVLREGIRNIEEVEGDASYVKHSLACVLAVRGEVEECRRLWGEAKDAPNSFHAWGRMEWRGGSIRKL